jgi:low temperature requirement protein LtrA
MLMLTASAAMLGLALALPQAFGDDAILFGLSFLAVRVLHLGLYAHAGKDDPDLLRALLRIAPTEAVGALLLLAAAFLSGDWRIGVWVLALSIDYLGPAVVPLHGWRIAPDHFAERYGLVVLIALGESVIAIGVGAGFELTAPVVGGAALGLVVLSALWWLYFDVAAIFARRELVHAEGVAQARLARDAYSYLHLPIVAGIVFFAFALEATLHHITATLDPLPAVALCSGAALYLLAHVAFLWRSTGRIFRRRTLGAAVLLALHPGRTQPSRRCRACDRQHGLLARRRLRSDPLQKPPLTDQTPQLSADNPGHRVVEQFPNQTTIIRTAVIPASSWRPRAPQVVPAHGLK